MAQEVEVKIKVNTTEAVAGVDKLSKGLKGTATESKALNETMQGSKQSEFINQLGDGVSKLNPAFGSAVKGANGLILKMWEMVANPVGAILAGIVVTAKFLYEAFQSSVEGGKELKAAFAAISAVGTQVKDAIFGLGRALMDVTSAAYKFITLDFAGASEDMKKANNEASESYKQLGNAVDGTTYKIMYNLERQQQANDKARKIQAVVQSETNKLLVKSRETLTDETASIRDKKKALDEVTKAESASSQEKVRIATVDLRIAQARAKNLGGEEEKKAKQELRDLTVALNEAQTENAMTGIKLNKQKKMLGRQEVADNKEKNDAINASNKEAYTNSKADLDERLKQEGLSFEQKRKLVANNNLITQKDRIKYNDEINKDSFAFEKSSIEEQLKNTKISIDEKRNLVLEDNNLSKKDKEKFLVDLQNQEILLEENHKKAILDLNKKYDDERESRLADTATKKEQLDFDKRTLEITNLAQTETEKNQLLQKLTEEHNAKLAEIKVTEFEKNIQLDIDNEALDFDEKRQRILDREEILLADMTLTEEQKIKIKQNTADAEKKIDNLKSKFQTEILKKYGETLSKGAELAGKNTAAGKAMASAAALINTYQGITAELKSTDPLPIKIASVAIVAATGFKAVSDILSVQVPGGGGGGSAGGSAPSIATPQASAPNPSVVAGSGINQLASTLGSQPPVKAYVVSKDISTQQGLDRSILNTASIG